MSSLETALALLSFLAGVLVLFSLVAYLITRDIRSHVEEALKNATQEEQDEIRKKVVKAMFPPRFHKD